MNFRKMKKIKKSEEDKYLEDQEKFKSEENQEYSRMFSCNTVINLVVVNRLSRTGLDFNP